jgi:hypothetical protein
MLSITLGDISPACAAYCHGIRDPVHVELDHRLPDGAALSTFTSVFHSASYNEDMTFKDVGYMLPHHPHVSLQLARLTLLLTGHRYHNRATLVDKYILPSRQC